MTLTGYVNSQQRHLKGLAKVPSSARTTKRPNKGKFASTESGRRTSQPRKRRSDAKFEQYVNTISPKQESDGKSVASGAQNLADILKDKGSVSSAMRAEKARNAKDFKIRKNSSARKGPNDVNRFLKKNKYVKVSRESNRASGYDLISDPSGQNVMHRHASQQQFHDTGFNSNKDIVSDLPQNDFLKSSDGFSQLK